MTGKPSLEVLDLVVRGAGSNGEEIESVEELALHWVPEMLAYPALEPPSIEI